MSNLSSTFDPFLEVAAVSSADPHPKAKTYKPSAQQGGRAVGIIFIVLSKSVSSILKACVCLCVDLKGQKPKKPKQGKRLNP